MRFCDAKATMRIVPALGWAVLAAAAVTGCGKGNFGEAANKAQQNIFSFSIQGDPTTLDPAVSQDVDTNSIMTEVFNGLVQWGADNKIQPCLAESWDIQDGGQKYIFHLRKDVKFSNGQPFTADDVKFSIDRACRQSIRSTTAADYLANIVGVAAETSGKADSVSGVKVLGPYEVEIDLVKPAYYFLGDLTMPVAFVVCKSVVPKDKAITSVTQMIGTGPFIPTKYAEDQIFSMKSNPTFFGGKPKIDGLSCDIVKDEQTRLDMFRQGQLDMAGVGRQNAVAMMNDPKFKADLHLDPRPATSYIAYNEKAYPPFANVHVRRAFCMAIDVKSLCKNVLGGINPPATGILPPGVAGFRKDAAFLPFDPAQARKELAEAGYSDGSKLPPVKLFVRSDQPDSKLIGEAVQSYLKKNLNLSISLVTMDWTTFLTQVNAKRLPMYFINWYADYLDPQDFINMLFATNGPENRQYYSNPEVDKLCAEAAPMPTDDPKRLAMYAKAEDLILQDAAWTPIFFATDSVLINPRVQGLQQSTMGYLPFNSVWLKN